MSFPIRCFPASKQHSRTPREGDDLGDPLAQKPREEQEFPHAFCDWPPGNVRRASAPGTVWAVATKGGGVAPPLASQASATQLLGQPRTDSRLERVLLIFVVWQEASSPPEGAGAPPPPPPAQALTALPILSSCSAADRPGDLAAELVHYGFICLVSALPGSVGWVGGRPGNPLGQSNSSCGVGTCGRLRRVLWRLGLAHCSQRQSGGGGGQVAPASEMSTHF